MIVPDPIVIADHNYVGKPQQREGASGVNAKTGSRPMAKGFRSSFGMPFAISPGRGAESVCATAAGWRCRSLLTHACNQAKPMVDGRVDRISIHESRAFWARDFRRMIRRTRHPRL